MNTIDRMIVAAILGFSVQIFLSASRIESKIDAMNTCGTAEVVVSGEGE